MSDLKQNILEHIYKSGFPLELEIVEILRRHNYQTTPNISFQDANGKNHEIDILSIINDDSHYQIKDGVYGTHLIVECKKTDTTPWVFFDDGNDPSNFSLSGNVDYESDVKAHHEILTPAKLIFHFHNHYGHAIPKARTHFELSKKPTDQSAIYKAVTTIFFARKFLKQWFSSTKVENAPRTFLNNFAIVFDGLLFMATKIQNDFFITEVDHILLKTFDTEENFHSSLLDNEIIIDVVKKEFFPQYLEMIKRDAELLRRYCEKGK